MDEGREKRWSKSYKVSCLELGWLKLENRRSYLALYKSCLNFEDYYRWKPISSMRSRAYNLGPTCLGIHFFVNVIYLWDKLPPDVVASPSLFSVKLKLKALLYLVFFCVLLFSWGGT